jgi:serine/threonine protein kinase
VIREKLSFTNFGYMDMEGTLIAGKYIVIRKLGEGASGQVYLVRHKDLSIRLALKILKSDFSEDPILLESFKREAEVLFRFSHEGCVQMRDFGALDDGSYFMATDFSEGGTLRDFLNRTGRLEVKYTLDILAKILDVLGAAHQLGIIHRDIKPENIMIERDYQGSDKIKVLDFGVAHLLSMEVAQSDEETLGAVGTPCYMSPEQALGKTQLDGRADIYAVGIVGYELLVGRVPFDGDDVLRILCQQVTQPPDPFPPGYFIPKSVERILFKALSKAREDRFQTAAKFRAEIDAILEQIKGEPDDIIAPVKMEGPKIKVMQVVSPAAAPMPAVKIEKEELGEPVEPKSTASPELIEEAAFIGEQTPPPSILVLDDDANLLNIVSHVLTNKGYSVFSASDVGSIHTHLFMNQVDLLITDVNMPKIDGVQVCKLFKKTLPSLKIILFSSIPERDIEKRAKECDADGFLSKNRPPNEWLNFIEEFLAK